MPESTLLLLIMVMMAALAFDYINGFHDTANAIATCVSTRALSVKAAIIMAASLNFAGALVSTKVATTIGKGIVDAQDVTQMVIFAGVMGAIIWNLITWYFGLPSSSSHALIGGLCGASLASAKGDWNVLIWAKEKVNPETGAITVDGIWPKVVVPMITSPILGFVIGFIFMGLLFILIRNWRPNFINNIFGKLQIVSAAYMGFGHGFADAQKTMGILALTLYTATQAGTLDDAPAFLSFLRTPEFDVATWIKILCAVVMAAGTWAGGWRIIKTLGHRMVKMKPVHGFAAEMTGATILAVTGHMGMPVSTTHTITTSIMGVGAAKRFNSIRWTLVERIVWAWVLTIPITAGLSYVIFKVLD